MKKTQGEMMTYRVAFAQLVTNRQPLDSWEIARLFYGVPRWAKWVHRDLETSDLIFTNKPL